METQARVVRVRRGPAGRVRVTTRPGFPIRRTLPNVVIRTGPVVRVAPRAYLGAVAFTAVALATLPPANVRVWSASEDLTRKTVGPTSRWISTAAARVSCSRSTKDRRRSASPRWSSKTARPRSSTSTTGCTRRARTHSSISRTVVRSITCASSPKRSATRPPSAYTWLGYIARASPHPAFAALSTPSPLGEGAGILSDQCTNFRRLRM